MKRERKQLNPAKLKNSMVETILILIFSAALATVIGHILLFNLALQALYTVGIFGLIQVFTVLAMQVTIGVALTCAVPFWGLFVGWLVSLHSASSVAHSPGIAGVILLSDTHSITIRVNELAQDLDLPPVKWVGWFEDNAINAFAMGFEQSEALIAFSSGAIEKLEKHELDAVMAHELAHVANHDMARMTYAYGIQESLTWFLLFNEFKQLARWLFLPLSELEIMRFSRQREFWADAVGAALTSRVSMASVLVKIAKDRTKPKDQQRHISHFMFSGYPDSWLATHPTITERVHALAAGSYMDRLPYTPESADLKEQDRPVREHVLPSI